MEVQIRFELIIYTLQECCITNYATEPNIDKLRTWLITVSSSIVGYSYSHNRLSCRHQYHQFCNYWQNLTLENYRFPFNTSSLARFRDCGLLRLHLLVLSHALSCKLSARSYFRTIGYFASPKSYTLLLYFFLCNTMAKFECIKDAQWTMRCTFDHSYLLSTTQPSPFCSLCYQLTFHSFFLSFDLRKKSKSIKH